MPVCRLIFRLDFKRTNFDILGQPGEVMKLLSSGPENFWSELAEATQQHIVTAKSITDTTKGVRQISVEPRSIHGSFESVDGVDLKGILKHESIAEMNRIIAEVCGRYKIIDLARAGFRIFYLNTLGNKPGEVKEAFKKMFAEDIVSAASAKLGTINDYAVSFDGEADDKLKYRYRSGPYESKEAARYFSEDVVPKFKEKTEFDFISEIDVYEQNFVLGDIGFEKWCRPVIKKMLDMIDVSEVLIKKRIEVN